MEIVEKIKNQNGFATDLDVMKLTSEYIKIFGSEYRKGKMNEFFKNNRELEYVYMFERLKEKGKQMIAFGDQ